MSRMLAELLDEFTDLTGCRCRVEDVHRGCKKLVVEKRSGRAEDMDIEDLKNKAAEAKWAKNPRLEACCLDLAEALIPEKKVYPPWAEFVAEHRPWPAKESVWMYDGHAYTVLTRPAKLKLGADEDLNDCPMVVYGRVEDGEVTPGDVRHCMVFCRPLRDFLKMFKEVG